MPGVQVHYVTADATEIDLGPHVFPIEKYRIVPRLVRSVLSIDANRLHPAEALAEGDLARVHTAGYLDDLRRARLTPATAASELPVEPEIIQGFLRVTGGSITALRLALDRGMGIHLGGGFHHAFRDRAEGFCYVNDIAVAIERLRHEGRLGRVLIVDVDVHQGNGTAAIYAHDPETFTYSIHQERNYPVKQQSDLDRGLPDGVGDETYLRLLRRDLDTIDERFRPQLVCLVAGVDPYEHDRLGGLRLTRAGLEARDHLVLERFARRAVPVGVVLAGGYARTPLETSELHLGTARAAEAVGRDAG